MIAALVAQPRLVRALAFNAFPLVIAAALVVRERRLETLVFTAMGTAMCLYTVVAVFGVYVP